MPKNARLFSSSSSDSTYKKRNKRNKRKSNSNNSNNSDSLFAHCTPVKVDHDMDIDIDCTEIDDLNCSKYYNDNNLVHSKTIRGINVIEYLNSRIYRHEELDSYELDTTEKDCIIINEEDNSVKINNELINSNNITISKYISNGCYGVIFVSSETDGGITYVIKLIINNIENKNANEIQTMIDIKRGNNTYIPNFINISYYHLNCKINNSNSNAIINGINICLKKRPYTMLIMEYFDDEIYSLLREVPGIPSSISFIIKKCIYSQILLSIYLLHNKFNYYHNDAHLKNFLYKKVQADETYFHYKITKNGTTNNYYIKNEGYIVVLSDFGLSQKKENREEELIITDDYYKILFELRSYILANANTTIKDKFNVFFSAMIRSTSFNEFEFLNFMLIDILDIKTTITPEDRIINDTPYE